MSKPVGINSKGHFRPRFQNVYIAHLDIEVRVLPMKKAKNAPAGSCAFVRNGTADDPTIEMYFNDWVSPPTAAHECVHAVQFIFDRKRIDMVEEMEHGAYLVDYLLAKVLGYSVTRDEKYT